MKVHLDTANHNRKPGLQNPIQITGLSCYQNSKGYWCLRFLTGGRKYLREVCQCSTSSVGRQNIKYGMARGIELETCETWLDSSEPGEHIELPEDSVMIYLVPESLEESKQIRGVFVGLPEKYSYRYCVIPHEDFYEP